MPDLLLELALFAVFGIALYPCVPRAARVNLLVVLSGAMMLRIGLTMFLLAAGFATVAFAWLRLIEVASMRLPRWLLLGVPVVSGGALLAWLDHAAPLQPEVVDWYGSRDLDEYAPRILPWMAIGVSFYTLQFVDCAVAVSRRSIPAPSLRDLALLLYCFPKFFAGPVVDSARFIERVQAGPRLTLGLLRLGLLRVACGLFLKLVIADRLGAYCDAVFALPDRYGALAIAFSFPLFGLQFAFELAAYLAVARGAACLVGIELEPKRAVPWTSADARLQAHWSLGVAGTLADLARAVALPRVLVGIGLFVSIGLWHRTRLEFVWLGLYFAAVYFTWGQIDRLRRPLRIAASLSIVSPLVCVGLVGIRLESLTRAFELGASALRGTFAWIRRASPHAGDFPRAFQLDALVVPLVCGVAVIAMRSALRNRSFPEWLDERPPATRWFVYVALVLGVMSFGRLSHQTLLYLRF